MTSGISITPALSAWIESPEPGISTSTTVSAWSITSTSAWPTPTVSRNTSSLPAASISSAVCSAASASPPSAPRVAIERMNTPGSRKCSDSRIRSPSSAPPRNGELGSIDSTATVAVLRAALASTSAPISVDLPAPGGPVKPTTAARAGAAGRPRGRAPSPRDRRPRRARSPRASARLSPASSRSARLAWRRPWARHDHISAGRDSILASGPRMATVAPPPTPLHVRGAPEPLARRPARAPALPARRTGCSTPKYARLIAALGVAEAALARAPADRRASASSARA